MKLLHAEEYKICAVFKEQYYYIYIQSKTKNISIP